MPSTTIGAKAIDHEGVPLGLELRPPVLASNPSTDDDNGLVGISAAGVKVGFQHELISMQDLS
jgi:hypothetical protein